MQAWDAGPERPDNRQPLRPEHFPLGARDRDIVTRDGLIIATIAEHAMPKRSPNGWTRRNGSAGTNGPSDPRC
jgi:hypothetical protein